MNMNVKALIVGLALVSPLAHSATTFSGNVASIIANSIPTSCTYPFHGGHCSFSAKLKVNASAEYIRVTNLSMPSSPFASFFDMVSGDSRDIQFNIEYDGESSNWANVVSLNDGANTLRVEFVEAGQAPLIDTIVISTPVRWNY